MWQHCLGLDIEVPDDFGNWLAGFMDADGSFFLYIDEHSQSIGCYCSIAQRDDNGDILHEIQEVLGIGHVRPCSRATQRQKGMSNAKDAVKWRVSAIGDIIHVIIPLFEKYPLRGKKKHDFELWARAARIIQAKGHLTKAGREEVMYLRQKIKEGRKYHGK